jgi:hypothetical protein
MTSNCSYIYYLEDRVKKSHGWEIRNGKRYFSLCFSGGYTTRGNNTLKEQIIDYFKEFDNINPEINNFNTKNNMFNTKNNMCGVHIFMTNDEYTIYKKIIEEKEEVIEINIDGLVIDRDNNY